MVKEVMQANLRYSEVVLRIRPLTAELDKLQESLAAGAARIEECTEELVTLDARKVDLQADLSTRSEEAAELKVRVLSSLPTYCSSTCFCKSKASMPVLLALVTRCEGTPRFDVMGSHQRLQA